MTKEIELTEIEQNAIKEYLDGKLTMFGSTENQMNTFLKVIEKAEMLMNDTNDEVGDDIILWFWNRYKDQKKSTIIHNIAIE